MSIQVEYICDICRDLRPKNEVKAVVFSGNTQFKLYPEGTPSFNNHHGRHICNRCLYQIKQQSITGES